MGYMEANKEVRRPPCCGDHSGRGGLTLNPPSAAPGAPPGNVDSCRRSCAGTRLDRKEDGRIIRLSYLGSSFCKRTAVDRTEPDSVNALLFPKSAVGSEENHNFKTIIQIHAIIFYLVPPRPKSCHASGMFAAHDLLIKG